MGLIMKSNMVALAIIGCQLVAQAKEPSAANRISAMDRAIAFAVELEIHANRLEERRDVCVGFGHGLAVNENAIISELNHRGLKLHPNAWCNQGPRGSVVSVIAPVNQARPNIYELVIQLGDLRPIKQEGEHFGTLLRRGTYVVQCKGDSEPELIAYQRTCCPEQQNTTP